MHSGVIHVSKHRCVSAHINGTNSHFEALALKFELIALDFFYCKRLRLTGD